MDVSKPPAPVGRRNLLKLALAAPGIAGLAATQTPVLWAAPGPAKVNRLKLTTANLKTIDTATHLREVGPRSSRPRPRKVLTTGEQRSEYFRVAGITWPGQSDAPGVHFFVRTRLRDGRAWSEWFELRDDHHGPDPASDEGQQVRSGTDPIVVGRSDSIEVRIESSDGSIPANLEAVLIEPEMLATPQHLDAAATAPMATETELKRPTIHLRADWGADESIRGSGYPDYGDVRGMFVHHSAGSNDYTEADVPGIISGIYGYHVSGRGWRDIGYNFLIDKFGGIWMGRWGGWHKAVIGAHTYGYNSHSFGVAVLGNYTPTAPEPAMLDAYQRLIAWKFALHDVKPTASVAYPDRATLPAISGHRDGGSTECPGDQLHAELDTVRAGVSDILANTALSSSLTLNAHTETTRLYTKIWFDVKWTALGRGVDGTVLLQRKSGSSWYTIRRSTVVNGERRLSVKPTASRIYRVLGVHSTDPLNVTTIGSNEVPMTAIRSGTSLIMKRAGSTTPAGEVPITVEWRAGGVGVTGRVAQQWWSRAQNRWITSKYVTVTKGVGRTILKPQVTLVYRMRAVSASSPSNVDTSHPASTSNEFRVIV